MATRGCMAAHVKVHKCGPGLLRPRPNTGPVCDDNVVEGKFTNGALCK